MEYSLTYFEVEYNCNNFDMNEFAEKLDLDLELLKHFSTDEYIEIGRNEMFIEDINIMIRETLGHLLNKTDVLCQLKSKYNLKYYLRRVVALKENYKYQKLSLDFDIIEFMYKTKTIDDLDYHLI